MRAIRFIFSLLAATAAVQSMPVHLRCEHLENPLGLDVARPNFSWQSDSTERNWTQSAYQLLVATRPELLRAGKADVWDSGKQSSADSADAPYAGPEVKSRTRYYWTVRVWDGHGRASQAEQPSWWEAGLRDPSDWRAEWIRWKNPEAEADRAGMQWIWLPGEDAIHVKPGTHAFFHLDYNLTQPAQSAELFLMTRGDWKVTVNGREAGAKPHWNKFDRRDVTGLLQTGKNAIDIEVVVPPRPQFGPSAGPPDAPSPGALAALLKIRSAGGVLERIATDGSGHWQARAASESAFVPAAVVGPLSDSRLGADPGPLPQPAALLRRSFTVSKPLDSARVYVTALGTYEFSVNGHKASPAVLMPGFTQFEKRVQYQTLDVTSLIKQGENVAGAQLGDGWFASGISWTAEHFKISPEPSLRAQLELRYADGTVDTIASDGSWKTAQSPILHAEIYAGESYDSRLEQAGWEKTGFADAQWQAAEIASNYRGEVSGLVDVPPQVVKTVQPERVTAVAEGAYVFDMGQNMVGWISLRVKGKAGDSVRLRFAEILNPDGSIYTTNLRNADATDQYTLSGRGEEIYTPRFTFHGFRYVEVSGYPGKPTLADITGQVISSVAGEPTATLNTSSDLVNRMWRIGIWGQRGNFLSVPTDCPQRDERLGWMGDAGVFWRTGSYNFDIAAFTQKWMRDVDDAQFPDGAFSNVSPSIGVGELDGAPGWSDAGIILPYTAWLQYGDRSIIQRNWASMERFMKFIADANPDFLRRQKLGPNFADWLAPDETTSKELVATAYWALVAHMMSEMAGAVGNQAGARSYTELAAHIQTAFQQAYVHPDGTVGSGTQTSYVLALYCHLLPAALNASAVQYLAADIEKHGGHLTTGFLGTPFLLFALSEYGRADLAYQLLLTETYPSWGYMLSKGATTWWERWNGDTGDPAMNSYNHYAFGSVVAWVYREVVGIDTMPAGPGFHEILIHPRPGNRITEARGSYESAYGRIATEWSGAAGAPFRMKVVVPPNTSAKIVFPGNADAHVKQNGKNVRTALEGGNATVRVGAGSYSFEVN